jgi:hypothetical protein
MKIYCAIAFVRKHRRGNNLLSPIAALVLASAATTASADVYTLQTSIATPITGIVNSTKSGNTGPVETSNGGFSSLASFSAVAGPGLLTAASSVNTDFTNAVPPIGENATATAFATMELDNIAFSGGSGSFSYSVNYSISGKITLSTLLFPDASGGVRLVYSSGTTDNVLLGSLGVNTDINDRTAPIGIFAGYDPTNPVINVSVNAATPPVLGSFSSDTFVAFSLQTSAHADSYPGASADLIVNFQDPFSLPTSGPVFNFFDPTTGLPLTGITANSSDGCIVNNAFMCGSITSPGSVPELSTWAMMLAGFAGIGLAGWRRGRRRAGVLTGEEIGL